MTITEKKPLFIQIPGEITPNELPISASAVGYDFIQGNYITYATGSDSWVTAPPNTAGIKEYWQSDINNEIFTTGSVTISGNVNHSQYGLIENAIYAHVGGYNTTASAYFAHAEGYATVASGTNSHAEGSHTLAIGISSHAEGNFTTASNNAHAEGGYTLALGNGSHTEGYLTTGSGLASHAQGYLTEASGSYSFAGGVGTIASGSGQSVLGQYNKRNNDFSLFVVGDGTSDADVDRRDVLRVNTGRVEVSGTLASTSGFSGSLTALTDGSPYLIAGTNIALSTGSNGSITINTSGSINNVFWQSNVANNIFTTGSIAVTGSITGAGGLQVAGIVPGISAPYNNTPVVIDLAAGQTYGTVIRSVAGQYNFAALSLDQNGTYLGGIYGIENDPGGFGYVDGVNIYSTGASRKINFNVNQTSVGRFTSNGLQVTGSIYTQMLKVNGSITDGTITIPGAGSGFSLRGSAFLDDTDASGNSYGTVIRSQAGNLAYASLTFIQDNTYAGSLSALNNTPSGTTYGYRGGLNISAAEGKIINFRIAYPSILSVGNFNANGLEVTGSIIATTGFSGSFLGNLNGTASYATNAATASYVQNAVSASYATVAVSLTTSVFNVALNGSAPGVSTNIGGIYIPASTTVTTKSLAYIGGSTGTDVAVLKMVPINSVTVSASWVITGTLSSVSLSSPATLGPGWYDLTLETGTVGQTAFGRGLYLTSGDI